MDNIPFVVFENAIARMERITKRLVIALIISVFLIFLSNIAWLYAWMQYDYSSSATTETSTVTVDGKDGVANYIGNDGDITNGKDNSSESENDKNESQNTGE